MNDELKSIALIDLLLWLLRLRRRFRVAGASMMPLLEPGDEVLVDPRAYRDSPPQVGEIVLAQHPFQPELKMVKRVASILEDGGCYLAGDNSLESSDSRSFGPVPPDRILGRVTGRFA